MQERMANWKIHDSMRGHFSFYLYKAMSENKDVWLLTGDLGYKVFDFHFEDFADRTINCGAAEQAMLDVAVGLTLRGKTVFVYSITPFLIFRGMETIRNYIDRENLPVKLIGSGRDKDYEHDGFSHYAHDVPKFVSNFGNIVEYYPSLKERMPTLVKEVIGNNKPTFVSLSR